MTFATLAIVLQAAAGPAGRPPSPRVKAWPSAYESALAFPAAAGDAGVSGRATLRCRVNSIGRLADCTVKAETPPGRGFGKAAMSLRSKVRMHPLPPGADPWTELTFGFDASRVFHIY